MVAVASAAVPSLAKDACSARVIDRIVRRSKIKYESCDIGESSSGVSRGPSCIDHTRRHGLRGLDHYPHVAIEPAVSQLFGMGRLHNPFLRHLDSACRISSGRLASAGDVDRRDLASDWGSVNDPSALCFQTLRILAAWSFGTFIRAVRYT